ncbi:MAG: CDP-alcohol phosphatidyltransferase family protein [Myxococcota bacterium]
MQALLVTSAGDPLRHVAGMSLLRRNLLTFRHAGAQRVVVVSEDEALRREVKALFPDVLAVPAAEALEALEPAGPVFIASASRVHDKGLGSAFARHVDLLGTGLALGLATLDPAGGPSGSAAGGPLLVPQPLLTHALVATAAADGLAAARASLGDRLAPVPVTEPRFIDIEVVDAASDAVATEALWQSCRKPVDGLFSRYFNRYISLFISRRIVDTPIMPNHISIFCIVLGVASAVAALGGTYGWILFGAFLFEMNSIIDGVDGELARVRWQFSRVGELLDSAGDNVANFSFYGALTAVMFRHGETALGWVGVATLSMWATHLLITYARLTKLRRGDVMIIRNRVDELSAKSGLATRIVDVLRYKILRRDGFVSLTLILAALGWHAAILYMVLAGASILFGNVVLHFALGLTGRGAAGQPDAAQTP